MFDVLVNGHKTSDYTNIWVANIPQIQPSETERDRHTVPQRDGDMLSAYYRRTSAYIEVTFHALNILQNRRIIKSVFCNQINELIKNNINLPTISILKDGDYDSYFNIRNASITADELRDGNYGRVTIQYEVEPFEYMIEDMVYSVDLESNTSVTVTVENDGDLCKPFITLQTLLYRPSDYDVVINIDGTDHTFHGLMHSNLLCFDSNLMITYYYVAGKPIQHEEWFDGNYEGLWLQNGNHDIMITNTMVNEQETHLEIHLKRGYAI